MHRPILYEAEGFSVKKVDLPGQGKVQCVLVRKAPEGEYDLEVATSLNSLIKEHVDGGLPFRPRQEEERHESLSAQVLETANVGDNDKCLNDLYLHRAMAATGSAPHDAGKVY